MGTNNLTQKDLMSILEYNKDTGIFKWTKSIGSRSVVGEKAGCMSEGYVKIKIYGKKYFAHRLAWLFIEGYFPENEIDHINRNPSDNRWVNLRHVGRLCNIRNSGKRKDNSSGVTGVSWDRSNGKWVVQIGVNNKRIRLGFYKDLSSAVFARWLAEKKYGFNNCNTNSSSFSYLKDNDII